MSMYAVFAVLNRLPPPTATSTPAITRIPTRAR
ncbi:Uncharacterised protein [Mycobacteroides abscessus]|nr:Uncharacterised protein [Mycobacteroides abscessus]